MSISNPKWWRCDSCGERVNHEGNVLAQELRNELAALTAERDALRERCARLARAARAATFVVHRDQVPFALAFADLLPGDLESEGVK